MPTPHNVRIASDFFHDSIDLLHRYRLTVDHFYAVKSKRFKLFIDLRIAAECILKSYVAYFELRDLDRPEVIAGVEKYGHRIIKLAEAATEHIDSAQRAAFEPLIEQLDKLPMGLRYRLDGMDFREINETIYYDTIGDDDWLTKLHDATKALSDAMNKHLQGHSRIISGQELLEEVMRPRHNKYAKAEVK